MTVETARGHRVQGTTTHRIKVVDPRRGEWVWRRFADDRRGRPGSPGARVLVGEPQVVPLPPLGDAYWTGEHHVPVPRRMTAALAELVGYFMGDGSLHSRDCVSVSPRRTSTSSSGSRCSPRSASVSSPKVTPKRGYAEVRVDSVRLALWWEACGFAKRAPRRAIGGRATSRTFPTPFCTPTTARSTPPSCVVSTRRTATPAPVPDAEEHVAGDGARRAVVPARPRLSRRRCSIRDRTDGSSWGTRRWPRCGR